MFGLTCLVLLLSIVVGVELQAKLNKQWGAFKSAHGKSYTGKEEKIRQEIFKNNAEKILQHNLRAARGEESYTMGINKFSDMTDEEFVEMFSLGLNISQLEPGLLQSPILKQDFSAYVPSSIDWRKYGLVTGVKDQGYYCSTCWAFAVTGAVEGASAKKTGKLISLSEQQLVECFSGDWNGRYPNEALDYMVKNNYGFSTDDCYPYKCLNSVPPSQCQNMYNPKCYGATAQNYAKVNYEEEALRRAVADRPVIVFDYFPVSIKEYRDEVFTNTACSGSGYTGNYIFHAMLVVGYGHEKGKDYWLVKNSWGKNWGDIGGYMKIERNARHLCGVPRWAYFVYV